MPENIGIRDSLFGGNERVITSRSVEGSTLRTARIMRLSKLGLWLRCRFVLLGLLTASPLLFLLQYAKDVGILSSPLPAPKHAALDPSVGQLDNSARYIVHTFLVEGSRWRDLAARPATIATHSSLDHLHWVVDTASSWTGPVSVAFFAQGTEVHLAVCYIAHLRKCHPSVMEKVSFHMVSPVDRPPKILDDMCQAQLMDCSRDPQEVLKEVTYEMFLAGWTFHVLNNVFLVHWGFQSTVNYPEWRIRQQKENAHRFKEFLCEMAVHYNKDPLGMLTKFPRKDATIVVTHAKKTLHET